MASYSKSGKRWRVAVAVQGVRDTKTFSTKAEAMVWGTRERNPIWRDPTSSCKKDAR